MVHTANGTQHTSEYDVGCLASTQALNHWRSTGQRQGLAKRTSSETGEIGSASIANISTMHKELVTNLKTWICTLLVCLVACGCSKSGGEDRSDAVKKTLERLERRSQQKKQAAIDVIEGRVAPPSNRKGNCPAPFYGIEPGDVITVEKNEQHYFGLPPGIYFINDSCSPSLTGDENQYSPDIRQESYRQAEHRLTALQSVFKESLKKAMLGQASERPPTDQNGKCPAPHQQFSPGQFVLVRTARALEGLGLPAPGQWYFDANCKPNWLGPVKVAEPRDVAAARDKEQFYKRLSSAIAVTIFILVLAVPITWVTKRITGRSPLGWLRDAIR